ncbi:MAG: LamG-like jellyroll fold domain-containing protein [Cyclobacteriaceae bacterium]
MKEKSLRKSLFRLLVLFFIFVPGLTFLTLAQTIQLSIPRVAEMPDLPSPYLMRDWKAVATQYDGFIFSANATGNYLPLISLKTNGINYPGLQPILLDTYVGSTSSGNQAEAINIIPALVGATLVGIDKSNQNGVNWTIKSKEFFNLANGQNVYLNGYTATSGSDWWYDLMPNIFFYQLYSQYPDITEFEGQFISIADRWLEAVYAMGGSTTPWKIPEMNYRAWKLASMTPNTTGVIEPEAAGTIAWLLYHAWLHTGVKKYLTGAQLSMDFLSNLNSNPSYELQLPYGAFIASKMNAELGTHYDLEKIVNWCFDRGSLRGWGVIAGKWNGSDVSGLIGEANDAGNDYAFAMNGFQQAAALVPMVKYDKRFARDIAKWTLNLANASRLYYPQFLPQSDQDDYSWSTQYDPQSLIAYEALKENWNGTKLYGTGDAKRNGWAQTNLGLYGSSHVGYLGAIIESTDVEGILKLDINKTDFFGENDFSSFLVYNPHADVKQITLPLGSADMDIYNAISETVIQTAITGSALIEVMPAEVMMLVLIPSGTYLDEREGKLYAGHKVVDYNHGYQFDGKLRIKSLGTLDTLVEFKEPVIIYSAIENETGPITYNWYVNGFLTASSMDPNFTWIVPEAAGMYTVKLNITSGVSSSRDSLVFRVVENIPKPPKILGLTTDSLWYYSGTAASVICRVIANAGNVLQYTWTLPGGSLIQQNDSLLVWMLPEDEGLYSLSCEVTNEDGLKSSSQINILVKGRYTDVKKPWAYYPMDGDVLDYSGNGHHATREGALPDLDARGESDKAYRFASGSDIIFVPNETTLNFQDEITLAFWVRLDAVSAESFILSHGSWEERWKVSVTPEKKLRWTIKTSTGTKNLDSSFPLALNHYYHFTVVYSGYSMELYVDRLLDTFSSNNGPMLLTTKALTFGRKDTGTTNYSLKGSVDEVRIYDKSLSPEEIKSLISLWYNSVTGVNDEVDDGLAVYPNPSKGTIHVSIDETIIKIEVWDLKGIKVFDTLPDQSRSLIQFEVNSPPGIYCLKIETSSKVVFRKIVIE